MPGSVLGTRVHRSVRYAFMSRSSQFTPKVVNSDAYRGQGCIVNK